MAEITFDDFLKVEMKIGKVLSAERIPKSDKLIKMQVSFGEFERQIIAGVGLSYEPNEPNDLIDRKLLFVTNLAPRKLMGHESHGMLLVASLEISSIERYLSLLVVDKDVTDKFVGAKVG
jgi:methionyl-tRNA synthetase